MAGSSPQEAPKVGLARENNVETLRARVCGQC